MKARATECVVLPDAVDRAKGAEPARHRKAMSTLTTRLFNVF